MIVGADGRPPAIVLSYMEHGSLAYGADWCRSSVNELPEFPARRGPEVGHDGLPGPVNPEVGHDGLPDADGRNLADEPFGCVVHSQSVVPVNRNDQLIASCSFYDHQLRIWTSLGITVA